MISTILCFKTHIILFSWIIGPTTKHYIDILLVSWAEASNTTHSSIVVLLPLNSSCEVNSIANYYLDLFPGHFLLCWFLSPPYDHFQIFVHTFFFSSRDFSNLLSTADIIVSHSVMKHQELYELYGIVNALQNTQFIILICFADLLLLWLWHSSMSCLLYTSVLNYT